MTIKSTLSIIALTAALGFSGSAFAQDTISEEDRPAVEQRCSELEVANSTESLTEDSDTSNEDETFSATIESVDDASELENAVTSIDLDTITQKQCAEWGITTM